ncbi:hypothetical protein VTH06DRAFT_6329 [Thermothelomyces fergusii]
MSWLRNPERKSPWNAHARSARKMRAPQCDAHHPGAATTSGSHLAWRSLQRARKVLAERHWRIDCLHRKGKRVLHRRLRTKQRRINFKTTTTGP